MPLTLESPVRPELLAPSPAGDRRSRLEARRAARRDALDRYEAASCKTAESNRLALCYGPHLIGWYPAGALAEVLADVERWGADPGHFDSLPWPRCCRRFWEWNAGENPAVWHAGRVLALAVKTAAGDVAIKRVADLD